MNEIITPSIIEAMRALGNPRTGLERILYAGLKKRKGGYRYAISDSAFGSWYRDEGGNSVIWLTVSTIPNGCAIVKKREYVEQETVEIVVRDRRRHHDSTYRLPTPTAHDR